MKLRVLRPLLLGLAGLTAGAALLKVVSLAAPPPQQEAPAGVRLPGYGVAPLGSSPGQGGRDLSHGTLRRFRLQPGGGAPAMDLILVPVRSRNSESLQMARLSAEMPELALSDRRLTVAKKDSMDGRPTEELAFGRSAKDPRGAITRLQTCVTPGGSSGVTEETLRHQLNLERDLILGPSPRIAKLLRQSGLISNSRWECMAVQLQSAVPTTPQRLQQVWEALKPTLGHTKTQ